MAKKPLDRYHVTYEDDLWKLTKEGGQRASKTAATKREIIDETREFMQNREASVRIHRQDGVIQEERTYPRKRDPRDSKG